MTVDSSSTGREVIGNILIVDDEVDIINFLVVALTSQGYQTVGLTSGAEALESLRTQSFDVLLTDLMMPQMDGITLVEKSLNIDPHLVCIMMTGHGTIQTAVDAMKVGSFDYVLKPFHLETLVPLIARAINFRRLRMENLQLRETVAIYELAQTIALTLDPQTIVNKLADSVLKQTDADEVSVLLPVNDGTGDLYVAAVRGENRERLLGERVPVEQTVSGWVARQREPLVLEGEINDQRFRALWPHPEIRSSVSIPLLVANKVVGTLNVNALSRPRPFTPAQVKVLTIVASTAAAALESASLYAQMRQSQKMDAIGQLAGGVAHDFNNLLTAINGYSILALQRTNPDDRICGYLEEIRKAGERASNLTRQLLAFGRKQMLKPVALNLNDVVSDMNKMLRPLIGEDIRFTAKIDPELKLACADRGQIEQVLVNLLVNGRDAMPHGGSLTIETANFEIDSEFASRHLGLPPGSYVMLAVSDTGCGMDEKTKARIFEPFFTTKEVGKGTGLGLSTVYGIVKQSGGSISVYSEPGAGTVFKVYFPQLHEALEAPRETVVSSVVPRGSETILLVEDEDMVRGLARQILEDAGYNVLDARGGDEAIRLSRERSGPIDLLLTDVVMPETSGKEIAQRLTEMRPTTRVLYMSGYTEDAIVRHGVLDSSVEFIQKPFTPVALARKVREVLDVKRGNHTGQIPGRMSTDE